MTHVTLKLNPCKHLGFFLAKRDLSHCVEVYRGVTCPWLGDKEKQLCLRLQKLLESTRWRYLLRLESLKNLVLITAAGAERVWRMLAPMPGSQSRKSSV